ncbi:MAG TPA: hypothetical protein VLS90_09640 [Thermodesulfobacteriota bacterium]|nr:hypothetical protein [Thermodesulfobacteriota bacterium]
MGADEFIVTRPKDFREFWDRAIKIVDGCDPEISVEKWEQEDPNFEDEYILDGRGRKQAQDVNPFDLRWDSHVIVTGLTIHRVRFLSYDGR